jgi:hypothetical protein
VPLIGTGTPSVAAVDSACWAAPSGPTMSTTVCQRPFSAGANAIVTWCGRSSAGMQATSSAQRPTRRRGFGCVRHPGGLEFGLMRGERQGQQGRPWPVKAR